LHVVKALLVEHLQLYADTTVAETRVGLRQTTTNVTDLMTVMTGLKGGLWLLGYELHGKNPWQRLGIEVDTGIIPEARHIEQRVRLARQLLQVATSAFKDPAIQQTCLTFLTDIQDDRAACLTMLPEFRKARLRRATPEDTTRPKPSSRRTWGRHSGRS
jgi:hypothetical protein